MMIIFIVKNGKVHLKMFKTSIFKIFFSCLYNFILPKYGTDRIRIKFSGSGSYQKGPDPTGSGFGSASLRRICMVWIRIRYQVFVF